MHCLTAGDLLDLICLSRLCCFCVIIFWFPRRLEGGKWAGRGDCRQQLVTNVIPRRKTKRGQRNLTIVQYQYGTVYLRNVMTNEGSCDVKKSVL